MSEIDRLHEALDKIAEVAHIAANGSEYLDTQHDKEGLGHAAETYQMVCTPKALFASQDD